MNAIAFLMFLTVTLGNIDDEFPFPALILLFFILLIAYKKTGRRVLIANIAIMGILVGGFANIIASGGIYSFNIRWTIVPLIIAFLISDRRSAITVLILNIISTFYLYKTSTPEQWHDTQFSANTYFLDNLFFMLLLAVLVYLFYIGQDQLSKEVEQKNDTLEQQNLTLKLQKQELDSITNKLRDSNQKLESYGHHTAHDLIQPASTISSFAQLVIKDIKNDTVTEKTKGFAELVHKSAVNLIEMSRNLLSYAKSDFEEQIKKQELDLNKILEQVKIKLSNQISNSNAQITTEQLPKIIGIDTQISSVFQNLISNAIIYRKANSDPKIHIQYENKEKSHLIKFKDNGIGIAEKNLANIFASFERIKDDGTSGTGLGLAFCKQIVEFHEGAIWAESNLGTGTTIFLSLPKSES